jgi:hypothetical protein
MRQAKAVAPIGEVDTLAAYYFSPLVRWFYEQFKV